MVRLFVCVCVCDEMWDDRQKEIQKKYEEGGKNSPLFFGCFETPPKESPFKN